jgi:hypothetical protein
MSVHRIAATVVIFLVACLGWALLGATTAKRSVESHGRLGAEVELLWGVPLVQEAPSFAVEIPGSGRVRWLMPERNEVRVALEADYRKKGLLWYPTYTSVFDGTYTVTNADQVAQKIRIRFAFPAPGGTYDQFAAYVNDTPLVTPVSTEEGIGELLELAPGQSAAFRITYKTRGIREWRYRLDPRVGRVRDLDLRLATNFRVVDYPDGSLSPMAVEAGTKGAVLRWQASDLITREDIGVIIPERLNPGPLTSRITYFAPVCLLFFFVLVATIDILYTLRIHPMHYLFVAAGFFAFHLLLAYMVGIINIHVAFVISAAVAVGLVSSYLSAAFRGRFPWKVAVAGQLFFLVLFSYSFFLNGVTGLTVAIGAVVTLAILMRVTAHVEWEKVFERQAETPELPTPDTMPAPQMK